MRDIVNDYHVGYPVLYEDKLSHPRGAAFLAVLVRDSATQRFAVYSGLVYLPDPTDARYEHDRQNARSKVALRGSKEPFDRAKTFFPALTADTYLH